MEIEDGWCFSSADFSLQTGFGNEKAMGFVVLVRAPDEKAKGDNEPPLFVVGSGLTLEDAISNANLLAAVKTSASFSLNAEPIKSYNTDEDEE